MRFPGLAQPPSYGKKKNYVLHQELGSGTFGKVIRATWTKPSGTVGDSGKSAVSEADSMLALSGASIRPGEKREVALKVIPRKKVKGNESVVWGEMEVILARLLHPQAYSHHRVAPRSCVALITQTS
jgi:calcium/calmodulin-dependent protein kinase I